MVNRKKTITIPSFEKNDHRWSLWEIIILSVSRYSSFLLECRYSRNFIQSCPANCNWIALEKMWLATPRMFWQTIEKCDGCRTGDGREEKVCRLRWLWQYDWAIWATEVTLAISKLLTSHCTCHLLWTTPGNVKSQTYMFSMLPPGNSNLFHSIWKLT